MLRTNQGCFLLCLLITANLPAVFVADTSTTSDTNSGSVSPHPDATTTIPTTTAAPTAAPTASPQSPPTTPPPTASPSTASPTTTSPTTTSASTTIAPATSAPTQNPTASATASQTASNNPPAEVSSSTMSTEASTDVVSTAHSSPTSLVPSATSTDSMITGFSSSSPVTPVSSSASISTGGSSGASPAASESTSGMTGTTATMASPTSSPASTAVPGTDITSSGSTGPSPGTGSATTTAPTAAPSTTPKHSYPTKMPDKPLQLSLPIGTTDTDALYCTNCSYSLIKGEIETAFSAVTGYLYTRQGDSTTQRKKRDTQFTVVVFFWSSELTGLSLERRMDELNEALNKLNTSSIIFVTSAANDSIIVPFAIKASDACNFVDMCNAGYRCEHSLCFILCDGYDCGDNGFCNAVVHSDGTSSAKCVCDSGDDYTYSGDHCENKEMSKAKVAAIVGGVLGTFCGLFLLIIIFLYCRLRGVGDDSHGKYQLGGYSNNGYAEHDFHMKRVSAENL